jgi:hypothetical protein
MQTFNVGYFVGSLSSTSINRKLSIRRITSFPSACGARYP